MQHIHYSPDRSLIYNTKNFVSTINNSIIIFIKQYLKEAQSARVDDLSPILLRMAGKAAADPLANICKESLIYAEVPIDFFFLR